MNIKTYLLPICGYDEVPYIAKAKAYDINDAKDKFQLDIIEEYKLEDSSITWDDFVTYCDSNDILIGDVYEIDEF